jgi:hypothetical protein
VAVLSACILLSGTSALAQETRLLSDFSVEGDWKAHPWNKAKGEIAISTEFPPSLVTEPNTPRKSLAATTQWPGGKDFAFFNLDPPALGPIPYKVLSISLWVKGTGTGHFIEVHFKSADNQDVKIGLGAMDFTDWRKLRKDVPANARQPLVLNAIVTHNWGLPQPDKVRLHLTRLEAVVDPSQRLIAEGGGPLFTVDTACPNGLVGDDGKASLTVRITSWQPGEKPYEVRTATTGWAGQKTPGKPIEARVKGAWQQTVDLQFARYGPLRFDAELWEPGGTKPLAVVQRTLIRPIPVPRLSPEQRLKSPMGVNGHYQSPWAALARMGIHWGRDYSWGWLKHGEKAPMADNGVDFALTFKAADDAGVTLLPITMRTFWDEKKKAFVEDEAAIAAAFARLGKAFPALPYWELDNEADLASPSHRLSLANYSRLIRAAAKGLREAGKAKVALNGTSGIQYHDTLELLKSPVRDDFAVVNYHYYTGTVPPELAVEDVNVAGESRREAVSFLDQLRRINRAAHAAGKETWLTEIGWDVTYGPAVGESLQAVYLPRVYLLSRWCGTDKVFWFFDRDVKGSKIKFASCGLIDADDLARPSAAAMAALSLFTAQAEAGGSVDLGDDRWGLLFKTPEGGWVAAVWSVENTHPMPKEIELAEAAYDLFGNKVTPKQIGPEVTYLHFKKLPSVWETQRLAEWRSPTTLRVFPGTRTATTVTFGTGNLSWEGFPKGVSAELAVQEPPGTWSGHIVSAPEVGLGPYPVRAVLSGNGWRRSWPLTLRVMPAVQVRAAPYTPGQRAALTLTYAGEGSQELSLEAPPATGTFEPATLRLEAGKPQTAAFVAAPKAKGVVAAALALKNGVRQRVPLRPLALDVAFLQQMNLYGALANWPANSKLSAEHFASTSLDFAPEAWLGWTPQGLCVSASFAAKDLKSGDPKWFWDNTCLELFIDTSAGPHQGWGKSSHQFWFTPVQESGQWRLYAGEWKRSEAIPETIYDDKRCYPALALADGRLTLKAFIPNEALGGAAPAAGSIWRAALALQRVDLTGKANAAWPVLKEDGLLAGAQNLGIIRLTDGK